MQLFNKIPLNANQDRPKIVISNYCVSRSNLYLVCRSSCCLISQVIENSSLAAKLYDNLLLCKCLKDYLRNIRTIELSEEDFEIIADRYNYLNYSKLVTIDGQESRRILEEIGQTIELAIIAEI